MFAVKGSQYKSFLQRAFVALHFGGIADAWFVVGMQYLKPKRSTFLQVELLPEKVWQHDVVKPLYRENGKPMTKAQIEVFLEIEHAGHLDRPLNFKLYRFVSFNCELPNWRPDRRLARAPLEISLPDVECTRVFWTGAASELIAERERVEQERQAVARRRENRKDKEDHHQQLPQMMQKQRRFGGMIHSERNSWA